MNPLDLLLLALEVALVLVISFILRELLRLRREVRLSQMALPSLEEARRVEEALREAGGRALQESQDLAGRLESVRAEVERLAAVMESEPEAQAEEAVEASKPVRQEPATAPSDGQARPGPRVLSEAGRAKYDKVLQLATRGLDAESIAREVDLTRAEVELMLGAAR